MPEDSTGIPNSAIVANLPATVGTIGQYLRSNGTTYVNSAILVGDIAPILPTPFIASCAGVGFGAGSQGYCPISGFVTDNSPESVVQVRSPRAGTIKRLRIHVEVNASTTNAVVVIRINGGNSGVAATITALTTGTFTDDVNTAAVALNDLLNYQITNITTGTIVVDVIQCDLA
jgi:hypothetical protein